MKMELPVNEHSFYNMLVKKGCSVVRSLEKQLKQSPPNNVRPIIVFTGTKLSSNFNVKDPEPFTEKHDVMYRSVCVTENCNEGYVGECARKLYERVKDHNGRDYLFHLVKHAGETGNLQIDFANFEVLGADIATMHVVGKLQKPY